MRKRSQCLFLSHQRYKIKGLASIFKVSRRTIERWFDSWEEIGVDALGIAGGREAKTLLKTIPKRFPSNWSFTIEI
ncbi:helix-turn-helix domain-containing protein [Flavobacterium sp. LB1P62]|uniref:helix-turn-helix domain-containing protein n=1 Tax=Flavobacterium sp. LB1P62 TaxID=3401715 RepID=UPI003AAEDF8A